MATKRRKKMTAAGMRSLIKFLIVTNVILLITIVVLAVLLAKARAGTTTESTVAIAKPNGSYTVCIDPGHGGSDTGAIGITGVYEKDGNLSLANKVTALLRANGVTVVTTRDDDTTLTLAERSETANSADADLFVSIHQNYAENTEAQGVEAWIYSSGSDKNYAIAEDLLAGLEAVGVSDNRGVKNGTRSGTDSDYQVIRETNMTSVILEMGFMSNEEDTTYFDENMDDYAAAIANGIIEWLNEYGEE